MNGRPSPALAASRLTDSRLSASERSGPTSAVINADDRGGSTTGLPSLTTFDAAVQLTRYNLSWSAPGQAVTVNYAYRSSVSSMPEDTGGFSQFTSQQIAATELALASWSDVANITFNRVTDTGSEYSNNAAILFATYASGLDGAAAFAYLPGSTDANASEGDVWVNSSLSYNVTPEMFGYGQLTLVHEIGHAIGLGHPAEYNAGNGQSFSYGSHAGYAEDSLQYTVMSYFSERETGADYRVNRAGPASYASAPLMDDIIAAQLLYGANVTTRTGDTIYGFNSNADRPWFSATASSPLIFCVWDAGGADTFDFSGFAQGGTIDLRQGAFSSVGGMIGNVSIVVGAVIENAIGSQYADFMRGNSGDNRFAGGGGADHIDGGLGTDTLVLSGNRAAYTLHWAGSVGYLWDQDKQVSFTNIEFLQFADQTIAAVSGSGMILTGDLTDDVAVGTAMADTIKGAGGDDLLSGGAGDDLLYGEAGDDVLTGGDGDDNLYGGLGLDILDGGAGNDTALFDSASVGITVDLGLGTAIQGVLTEQLIGFENVSATAGNDTLIGDNAANRLSGGGGADRLEGRGGDDRLVAGTGGKIGGAPDIVKGASQANNSIAAAVAITAFEVSVRHEIWGSTTVPHASVQATGHGGLEYYAVSAAAGETLTLDIDGAAFDSTLRIFNSAGVELARNDDSTTDAGRFGTDSGLSFTAPAAGVYYVQVGQWVSNVTDGFVSQGVATGQTYFLHVSSPGATPIPIVTIGSTLDGGDGADTLLGGTSHDTLLGGDGNDIIEGGMGGTDIIDGGDGDDLISWTSGDTITGGAGFDTVVYRGDRAQYTITVANGVVTVSGASGIDWLTGVERLHFADAITDGVGVVLVNEVYGTAGADVLEGTALADSIRGLDGDDIINGGTGDDIIDGGAGLDTAVFHTGYFASNIIVNTVDGVTTVGSMMGTDRLTNVERLQFYNATLIVGAGGGQYYSRGDQNDWLEATEFADEIESRGGSDTIFGRGGADKIWAGDGDDILDGGAGQDTLTGGDGIDTVSHASSTTGVEIYLDSQVTWDGVATDSLSSIENAIGSAHADYIGGDAGANRLDGAAGNDVLDGGGGDDVLVGGLTGLDHLRGGSGVDQITYAGHATGVQIYLDSQISWDGVTMDFLSSIENAVGTSHADYIGGDAAANRLDGGAGDDYLEGAAGDDVLIGGLTGLDHLRGGEGVDQITYAGHATGVQIYLDTEVTWDGVTMDFLSSIENAIGTSHADYMAGNAVANRLEGGAGDDFLEGGGGDDVLIGGTSGLDHLRGGAGVDQITYAGHATGVQIYLDTEVTWDGVTMDFLSSIENAIGSSHADYMAGNAGANRLEGGAGDDFLDGGAGDDFLDGGASGLDSLRGGAGSDTVSYASSGAGVEIYLDNQITWDGTTVDILSSIENIVGSAHADYMAGDAGDNLLEGGGGDDVVNGGAGTDLFVLRGLAADYTITAEAGGFRVTDAVGGRDGSDLLTEVETLRFGDGTTMALAPASTIMLEVLPALAEDKAAGPHVLPGAHDDRTRDVGNSPEVLPAVDDSFMATGKLDLPPVMPPMEEVEAGSSSPTELEQARELMMALIRENPLNSFGDPLILTDLPGVSPQYGEVWE